MPEWEAFYFRKFFKNGYLICISKMVRILAFCWNSFFSYFLIILEIDLESGIEIAHWIGYQLIKI